MCVSQDKSTYVQSENMPLCVWGRLSLAASAFFRPRPAASPDTNVQKKVCEWEPTAGGRCNLNNPPHNKLDVRSRPDEPDRQPARPACSPGLPTHTRSAFSLPPVLIVFFAHRSAWNYCKAPLVARSRELPCLLALIEFVSAFLRAQIGEEGSAALAGQTFITLLRFANRPKKNVSLHKWFVNNGTRILMTGLFLTAAKIFNKQIYTRAQSFLIVFTKDSLKKNIFNARFLYCRL